MSEELLEEKQNKINKNLDFKYQEEQRDWFINTNPTGDNYPQGYNSWEKDN